MVGLSSSSSSFGDDLLSQLVAAEWWQLVFVSTWVKGLHRECEYNQTVFGCITSHRNINLKMIKTKLKQSYQYGQLVVATLIRLSSTS